MKTYNIELSSRVDRVLSKLALEKSSNKGEVLRFAIDYLDEAIKAKNEGFTLGAWAEDQVGCVVRKRIFAGV